MDDEVIVRPEHLRMFNTQVLRKFAQRIRGGDARAARRLHEYLEHWHMGSLFYRFVLRFADRSQGRGTDWTVAVSECVAEAVAAAHLLRAEGVIDG